MGTTPSPAPPPELGKGDPATQEHSDAKMCLFLGFYFFFFKHFGYTKACGMLVP